MQGSFPRGVHWQRGKDSIVTFDKAWWRKFVKTRKGENSKGGGGGGGEKTNNSVLPPFQACDMEVGLSPKNVQAKVKYVWSELGT